MTLSPALAPLAAYHQFILCEFVPDPARPGKTNKYPLHPQTLRKHDAHDPAVWMPYDTAAALAQALGPAYGVGFTFTAADPFWFVDIDGCLTPDGWSPIAQTLCTMLPGAAVEISHSGQGLHIIGSGPVPPHGCKNIPLGLEFYDSLRFCALGSGATGSAAATPDPGPVVAAYFPAVDTQQDDDDYWTVGPAPEANPPTDDDDLIARAMRSGSAAGAFGGRASFADLWTANETALSRVFPDYGPQQRAWDASNADAALAQHLAFWTGRDCERIQRLMERSALVRDKWQRPDYLHRTIGREARRCRTVYGQRAATEVIASEDHQPGTPADIGIPASGSTGGLTFSAAAAGAIPATVATVEAALLSAEGGVRIQYDSFKDRLCMADASGVWRPFRDADYGHLRAALERRGFKPISSEVMHTAVGMVADRNSFDSAIDWANSLVWDGVPRVTTALSAYYGVADTPYSRASGEYLFTALAGRCMQPGCQADMALILVGLQGARKTSAVSVLAPDPEAFTGVDLARRDDDLARRLRGRLVVELAEMRGLSRGRELEAIKDWITRRVEEWTPKYKEYETRFSRRCVLLGTANTPELLDDETGERRWLPQMAGQAQVEALQRDRDQLWAEGIAMWRAGGIRWQEAERLAVNEHEKFKVHDEWRGLVEAWLHALPVALPGQPVRNEPNGNNPFSLITILREALGVAPDRATMAEQKRVAKILRALNYEKQNVRADKTVVKLWTKVGGATLG